MLAHRLRRRANIKTALGQCRVFAGRRPDLVVMSNACHVGVSQSAPGLVFRFQRNKIYFPHNRIAVLW